MKSFLVSLIAFSIVAAVVWGVILAVVLAMNQLELLGMPAPIGWIGVGIAVVLCKPGSAIVQLSSYVWSKIDALFWRIP